MEKKTRIIILWLLIIAGFLIHSLTDALPAFWGDSIVVEQGPAPPGMTGSNDSNVKFTHFI